MKKMLLATALALLITGMLNRRLLFKTKTAAVAPKETITHHFSVSGIGQKSNCRCSQNYMAENVVKTEKPSKISGNGLLGFITFRHLYSAGSACVLLTIIA